MLRPTPAIALVVLLAACTTNPAPTTETVAPTTTQEPTTTATTVAFTTTEAVTSTVPETTTTLAPIGGLDSGLFCRDLAPLGYSYADAVAYWTREGRPDRMDADRNGIPCETVYDRSDVVAFWGEPLPTTTTTTIDVFFSVETHGLHPRALPGSGGAFGSGCSPGSTTLPDGIWYGYARAVTGSSITFDLACLRWIPDPDDDAVEEGGWEIENNNAKTRVVPVHPLAQATCYLWGCPSGPFSYADWMTIAPVFPEAGSEVADAGIWLYVNDGEVTEVGHEVLAG